jgi:hypothetical protein
MIEKNRAALPKDWELFRVESRVSLFEVITCRPFPLRRANSLLLNHEPAEKMGTSGRDYCVYLAGFQKRSNRNLDRPTPFVR